MFSPSKPASFALSLLVHGSILAWVASGPVYEKQKSLFDQAIKPHADKLVWYDFRAHLPDIAPAPPKPASEPLRAEVKLATQEIVAGSPKAPHAQQFVWQPAPKVELKQDLRSPNLLAFHAPHVDPPPKPKAFIPPPVAPKPAPAPPSLAPAPELRADAGSLQSPLKPALARPQPKPFSLPEFKRVTAETPKLEAPPAVAAVNLDSSASAPIAAQLAKPVRRAFVPPTGGGGGKTGAPVTPLPDAPALPAGASNSPVSVAIVSLNPAATANVPLPEGSRDGQFSAGPHLRATGGAGGAGNGKTLVVPGLMIRNPDGAGDAETAGGLDSKPILMARAGAPTSLANLRAAVHTGLPASDAAPPHSAPTAIKVASAPDQMFEGRDIYAMTVQMPNVTSYAGSWMIWFADQEHPAGPLAPIVPPVPWRKVDPKYIASAVTDRIEGKVRLSAMIRADGRVDSVKLLSHLDDRLDSSAVEAIGKWQFEPARRNGQPVEVEAVIEIPFRLAPLVRTP